MLLGILGLLFHFRKNNKDAWIVLLLFVFTGIAIVLYLNQPPIEPRERDYTFVGSFYAFAIWIGIGVSAIYHLLDKYLNLIKQQKLINSIVAFLLCLILVPIIMVKENWNDHDRSGRYWARDVAYNYLNSCAPNALLFTVGDNDTFPLWYAQEVEGIRPDVRIICMTLMQDHTYIDPLRRKINDSEAINFTLTPEKYVRGKRDAVYIASDERLKEPVDLKQAIDFINHFNVEHIVVGAVKSDAGHAVRMFDFQVFH